MKRINATRIAGKAVLDTLLTSALFLALTAFTLTTAASAAELIVNGGFEEPVVDLELDWSTYYGMNQPLGAPDDCPVNNPSLPSDAKCNDDVRVPGWDVFWTDDIINNLQLSPGRLEIQTGMIHETPAHSGLQKAELDSHHRNNGNENTNATITQYLPTCPLEDYTLTYAWKSRTETPGDNDTRVIIDDTQVNVHTQNSDWQTETVNFTSDNSGETLILFGSIGSSTTTGMFLDDVSVTGPDCSLVCDEKPYDITLRYDGDDDTHHDQSGSEVIIYPKVVYPFPNTATIKVFSHNKRKPRLLDTFENVDIGDLFSVSNTKSNWRIPPRLVFQIFDPDKDESLPVQTVMFHTSCSQPLNGGDEFGAITVWNALP